jgi:hypothetical protein
MAVRAVVDDGVISVAAGDPVAIGKCGTARSDVAVDCDVVEREITRAIAMEDVGPRVVRRCCENRTWRRPTFKTCRACRGPRADDDARVIGDVER